MVVFCPQSKRKVALIVLALLFVLQMGAIIFPKRESFVTKGTFHTNNLSSDINYESSYLNELFLYLFKKPFQGKSTELPTHSEAATFESLNSKSDSISGISFNKTLKPINDIKKSPFNIFFIESKCGTMASAQNVNSSFKFLLNPRQSCSVESAALKNPRREVYIFHTCPLTPDFVLNVPRYAWKLLQLPNVHVVPVKMDEVMEGSPVQELYKSRRLENSSFPIVHASDILRLVVLWKFGGTYCDMDILSLRPLDGLTTSNFCGLESHKAIGNSILNFEPCGYGHEVVTKLLQDVNNNFDGSAWAVNGPDLITKIILQECNATIASAVNCTIFKVYSQPVLYPLLWKNYLNVFDYSLGPSVVEMVKKTGFTVHFWNKYSSDHEVLVGSSQAYGLLADELCPSVYRNCGETF